MPRRANLMTVFGEPVVLPTLEAPSKEDVDKWHATYVEVIHMRKTCLSTL